MLKLCKRSRKFTTARVTVRDQFLKKFFTLRTAPWKRRNGVEKVPSARAWTGLRSLGQVRITPRATKRMLVRTRQIRLIVLVFQG